MAHLEKQVGSEMKFAGRVISVTLDTVLLENGNESTREVVHHTGGAGIVAMNDNGEVIMISQFRYPFGKELIEIPAGRIEKGEDPKTAAIRELEEEAGIVAETVVSLGEFYPTCGYCNEITYLYAAKNLKKTQQNLDPDEFVTPMELNLEEVLERIDSGEIKDGKTIAAVYKLKRFIDKGLF